MHTICIPTICMKLRTVLTILFICTLGVLTVGLSDARAAKFMKLGYALAKDSSYDTFAKTFAEEVERGTAGEVKVKNFCCLKMGGEQEMFKKLQLGTLDATIIAQNNVGPFYPKIDLLVLPYMLRDYDHALAVVDGPIGKSIWKDMPAKAGVHLVKITSVSFRHVYNTKSPIRSIADFKPLKYRVPKNVVMVDTYKAFGSDPVPLAWSETLTAVQTGTVDGGDLPIDIIFSQKFHEVAKHVALTGHFALTPPFLVSDRFMQKLSAAEKTAVYAAADVAARVTRQQVLSKEAQIMEVLRNRYAVTFTEPSKAPFIEAAEQVQAAFFQSRGEEYRLLIESINAVAQ